MTLGFFSCGMVPGLQNCRIFASSVVFERMRLCGVAETATNACPTGWDAICTRQNELDTTVGM